MGKVSHARGHQTAAVKLEKGCHGEVGFGFRTCPHVPVEVTRNPDTLVNHMGSCVKLLFGKR